MPKLMVLRGLPRAGAYRPPPGRIVSLGQLRSGRGADIRGAQLGALGLSSYGGLGTVTTQDRATALRIAESTRQACRSACNLITTRDATQRAREISQCQAGCDAAYHAATAAIEAGYSGAVDPGDPTGGMSDAQMAQIQALLASSQQASSSSAAAPPLSPPPAEEKILGMKKSTALVVGGVLALAAAYVVLK